MTQPAGQAREAVWGSGVVGSGEVNRGAGGAQAGWRGSGDRVKKDEQFIHFYLILFCLVLSICYFKMLHEEYSDNYRNERFTVLMRFM